MRKNRLIIALMVLFCIPSVPAHACGDDSARFDFIFHNINPNVELLSKICHAPKCRKVDNWFLLKSQTGRLIFINQKDIVFVSLEADPFPCPWRGYFKDLESFNNKGVIQFPQTLSDALAEIISNEEKVNLESFGIETIGQLRINGKNVIFDLKESGYSRTDFQIVVDKLKNSDWVYKIKTAWPSFKRWVGLEGVPKGCSDAGDSGKFPSQPL